MKCSACANDECEGKYENRHKCTGEKEGIECSCYCRRTKSEVFFSSLLSIGTGVAVAAAGIGLTVATGGLAAVVGGAAIAGGGTSLVISPIQKLVTKECVTFSDSAKEMALGATIGAVTGPIGALGSTASKGATVAVRVGARIVAGSAAGATSGVICEGAKLVKGEEVSWESLGKSVAIGAVAGSVGGASTSLAHSSVCKPVADVIGKPAMRVITQATTSMATDAGVQLATTGEIDPKLLLANTTGQVVCGTTAEVASSIASSSAGRSDKQPLKESKNDNKPDKPDSRPDHKPGKNQDNFGDKKPAENFAKQKNTIDFYGMTDSDDGQKVLTKVERSGKQNILDQKPFQSQANYEILKSHYVGDFDPTLDRKPGQQTINKRYMQYRRDGYLRSPEIKQIKQMQRQRYLRILNQQKSVTNNYLITNQYNYIFEPLKNNNVNLPKFSSENFKCLEILLDIRKIHKSFISRESIENALKILRNTNDPEVYATLLQYNIPLDTIGIEATRLMLEQILEMKIKIEVTFNESSYIFGATTENNDAKVIHLDLINGHFINELQDGDSALYNDCLYYAIAEQLTELLDMMTPDEMRRNISDIIKTNHNLRSIIVNRDHSFYIDNGFFGGRQAERESDDFSYDPYTFWDDILVLLRDPEERDHSYDAIDQVFSGRFSLLYLIPLEIDHVLPVNVWVQLFISLKKSIKSGRPNQTLLRMFKILTGLDDPIKLGNRELKALVKKKFPCIILMGLVHRNLLTTSYSFTTISFCGLLAHYIENDNLEEALKMIFQDQHNTSIHIREQFPNINNPLTLAEELYILHAWQRSLIRYYLRLKIINEEQANNLFGTIDEFPIEAYDESFRISWERFMTFSNNYIEMYEERGLLIPDDEDDLDEVSPDED